MKFVNFNGAVTERILWRLHNQGEKDETYGKESIATLHNGIVYVFSSGRECNYGIDLYSATNTKLAGSIRKAKLCHSSKNCTKPKILMKFMML